MLRVSAKLEYTLRALVELELSGPGPVKGDTIARRQNIPVRFLEATMTELRHAGLISSRRGSEGGYWLRRPAREITVAEVSVAVEGDLVEHRPRVGAGKSESARHIRVVWETVYESIERVLVDVTIEDLALGRLPQSARDGKEDVADR